MTSEPLQTPDTSAVLPTLDDDESEVMALVTSAYRRIRGWGLRTNDGEIEQAIHVIQGFIIQHMLQRLNPDQWGAWFDPNQGEGGTDSSA